MSAAEILRFFSTQTMFLTSVSFWNAFVIIRSFSSKQQSHQINFSPHVLSSAAGSGLFLSSLLFDQGNSLLTRSDDYFVVDPESRGEGRQPACPCCYARCLPITWDFITRWICEWGRRCKQRGWKNQPLETVIHFEKSTCRKLWLHLYNAVAS